VKPATALPWRAHNLSIGAGAQGPYNYPLGPDAETAAQNADYIAHAANAYPQLVAALREWLPADKSEDGTQDAAMRALLASLGESQ
jgi:hypothetical protein